MLGRLQLSLMLPLHRLQVCVMLLLFLLLPQPMLAFQFLLLPEIHPR